MTTRRRDIDALKGLSIVGVLFAHMSFTSRFDGATIAIVDGMQVWFGWCVIGFFYAAGALSSAVKETSIAELAKRRARRLLVPYVAFSLTNNILLLAMERLGLTGANSPAPTGIGGEAWRLVQFGGVQFYFLAYLFQITVAVAMVVRCCGRIAAATLAGAGVIAGAFLLGSPSRGFGSEAALVPLYVSAYVAGLLVGGDEALDALPCAILSGWPVLAAAALTGNPVWLQGLVPLLLSPVLRWLVGMPGSAVAEWLGRESSGIYAWHTPIVMPVASIACTRLLGGGPAVILPVLAITVAASLLLHRVTEAHPFLRPWRL